MSKSLRNILIAVAVLAIASQACLKSGGWATSGAAPTVTPLVSNSPTPTLPPAQAPTQTQAPAASPTASLVPVQPFVTVTPVIVASPTVAPITPTTAVCPIAAGTVSHDTALINAAIAKLNLPFVQGKPYPVTNATQLLEYFSITLDPALVEVDSDCTTLQIPPQKVSGTIVPFWACNPTDRWFDGWRASKQPDGTILDLNHQQGFPTGGWLMEGISFAPKDNGDPIIAVPNACTTAACPILNGQVSHDSSLINIAIAKLNLPQVAGKPYPVTNATQLLEYFSITLDSSVVEVDEDCTTLQIPPQKVSGNITAFYACNPTDRNYDGWKNFKQDFGNITFDEQQGFSTGQWNMEGISFAPKANGDPIEAIAGVCQ